MSNKTDFKFLDLVIAEKNDIFIILVGPLNIPYCEDGCASQFSTTPLDIQNPKEWKHSFIGYICFDLVSQETVVVPSLKIIRKLEQNVFDGSILFDVGTSRLRSILGLLKMSAKFYEQDVLGNNGKLEINISKDSANIL